MGIFLRTTICIAIGFVLDLIVGDPHWLPHPVILIGKEISFLEKRWNREEFSEEKRRRNGICLVLTVVASTLLTTFCILWLGYYVHWILGMVLESIMCFQVLATKCLKVESMAVYHVLQKTPEVQDGEALDPARKQVSMIVGRDTKVLDRKGIVKAAVETVAENTSDGIIAPMFYLLLGGPVFAFAYKAVNTMDSMVGYQNDRYLHFGRTAAKLDDVVNFIPARLSAVLMCLAAYLDPETDGKEAVRIFKRDRFQHASPNSAQTESVCAGALHIQLAGDAWYFGKCKKKPFIGDQDREVEDRDIIRANRLLYGTAFLMFFLMMLVRWAVILAVM